jgi:hypothetical protein
MKRNQFCYVEDKMVSDTDEPNPRIPCHPGCAERRHAVAAWNQALRDHDSHINCHGGCLESARLEMVRIGQRKPQSKKEFQDWFNNF